MIRPAPPPRFASIGSALYLTTGGAAVTAIWFATLDFAAATMLSVIGAIFGVSGLGYLMARLGRWPHPVSWILAPIAGQSWGIWFSLELLIDGRGETLSHLAGISSVLYGAGASILVLSVLRNEDESATSILQ
ncbi:MULTISPECIES: hypothetical protein [unclassified Nocardia]|uniref:hypothetical protein n=1 Tax=unclassified Nocardia TaxID=2637762 RepID=UPI001CE3C6F5|nr:MULTISPECIES: hypothetical protein [unclassified Nocardia]